MLSTAMVNARKFILDHGGLEKAQVMTKYKLATFGQYEWQLLNYIPLLLFKNEFPLYSYGYVKGIFTIIKIMSRNGSIPISPHSLICDIIRPFFQFQGSA